MPLSLSQTREILQRLSHQPRKQLGQNFLVDGNIVRKSIELAKLKPGEPVVEVGPGLGTLTRTLLEAGAQVWAVEHDRQLAEFLRAEVGGFADDRFNLLEADAVTAPRAGLPDELADAGFKIVANLPYAISTPWLDAIMRGPLPERMVLMLQWEAAQRYMASSGTKQFGAISIFLQSAYIIEPGHRVAASCFHPPPEVESYLLNISRRPDPFVFLPAVRDLIRRCFQQRRKQVQSLLRGRLPDDGRAWLSTLAEEQLDGRARPEQIPTKAWQRLTVA